MNTEEKLNGVIESLKNSANTFDQVAKLGKKYEQLLENGEESTQNLDRRCAEIRERFEEILKEAESLSSEIEQLKNRNRETVEQVSKELSEKVRSEVTAFGSVQKEATDRIVERLSGVQHQQLLAAEKLQEYSGAITDMITGISAANDHLNGLTKEMHIVSDKIEDTQNRFSKTMDNHMTELRSIADSIKKRFIPLVIFGVICTLGVLGGAWYIFMNR